MELVWGFGNQILLKNLKAIFSLIFFLPFFYASTSIASEQKIIRDYLKAHKNFRQNICRPGEEKKFLKYYKAYLKDDIFIPVDDKGHLDSNTIHTHIPIVEKKINWIDSTVKKLKKENWNRKSKLALIRSLFKEIKDIQELKEQVEWFKKKKVKSKFVKRVLKLKGLILSFIKTHYYLHSFEHPNDFLELRKAFEEIKDNESKTQKEKINFSYFYRKILEDGAMGESKKSTDRRLRAILSSLAVRLQIHNNEDFYDEDFRYDLVDTLRQVDKVIRRGKHPMIERLEEWKNRTERHLNFYRGILGEGSLNKGKVLFVEAYKLHRYELQGFVKRKHAEVYAFWAKMPLNIRQLFVLETILMNEVGTLDNKGHLEKKAVAEVVLNRTIDGQYSQFSQDSELAEVVGQNYALTTKEFPWMNVLFRKGEFSFTYYFLDASRRVFCPDMSRRAQKMRLENLRIALKTLEEKTPSTTGALRYFSRSSMFARIDMSKIWHNYNRIEQTPGQKVSSKKSSSLERALKKSRYQYLYKFSALGNKDYRVVEIDHKTYVVDKKHQFFHYRNPHHFSYFKRRPQGTF